jgi:steroid delta-isomerase-like uncharacterized protein
MSEQDNIKAAVAFFEAWNAGDLTKAEEYNAPDFMAEGPGASVAMNNEQNRTYLQNFKTAFPDTKFEVLLTITQGDYVVTHWKASGGTHSGPLMTPSGGTVPPTGKSAVVMGSTTTQLKNGKIIHTWTFWDMASLLGQLGLMPPM